MEDSIKYNLCVNCEKPIIPGKRSKRILDRIFHKGCRSQFEAKNLTKYCECGCGQKIPALRSDKRLGRFVLGHFVRTGQFIGDKNYRWNGGRRKSMNGYSQIRNPHHPFCTHDGYVFEHRIIWEQHHNAILLKWADVHHINGIKTDNRIENLEAMMHYQHTILEATKDMSNRICLICKQRYKFRKWFRHPITKEEWVCSPCYRKTRNKIKKNTDR